LNTAKATLRDRDKKDPDAAKKTLLDAFSELGIRPVDLQAYLKHPTDHLSPAELQDLRGIYRAVKDGEARWADYLQASDDRDDEIPVRHNLLLRVEISGGDTVTTTGSIPGQDFL
jgi:hypothetical protein